MESVLTVHELSKEFSIPGRALRVLDAITFDVPPRSTMAIVGPSGSGKTTLLGLCAGLDRPSTGTVTLTGVPLHSMDEDGRAGLRNEKVGFVFQNFQLMPTLTALENVMLPAELLLAARPEERARKLLEQVGLGDRMGHYPVQLSGGEQQRVSLARAFINEPAILFADEPTGNLDDDTSQRIIQLLFDLHQDKGTSLILVTHNLDLAERCQRIIRLRGGRMVEDRPGTAVGTPQPGVGAR